MTTTPPSPPSPQYSRTDEPTTPRQPTHLTTPPRSDSLSNRSPRLGQASFDQSVAQGTGSPRLMQPRKLFAEEQSPLSMGRNQGPGERTSDDDEIRQTSMSGQVASYVEDKKSGQIKRPPALTFAKSDQAMLPNLRYSSSSSTHSLDKPSSPTLSSSSSTTRTAEETKKEQPVLKPSLSILFSLTTRSTFLTLVLPALALSIGGGLIPPYMTQVLGDTFQHFTDYSIATANPELDRSLLSAARSTLLNKVRLESIKFAALGAGILLITSANQALWDKGMGGQKGEGESESSGDSAAGLMGRFTKDTDDVRIATSQTLGMFVQYCGSFIFCLALSFYRDYRLTFVILAAIPILTIFVGITERFAQPLANRDREAVTRCSSRVDRIIGALPTVKAFNAEDQENAGFKLITKQAFLAYTKLHFVWGFRSGITQFMIMTMFIQGFWFGAYLVQSGKATVSTVNTCFWSCLSASTYLQTCIPFLVSIEKGKIAMAGLLGLIHSDPAPVATLVKSPSMSRSHEPKNQKKKSQRIGSLSSADISLPSPTVITFDQQSGPLSPHPFTLSSPTTPHTPVFIPLASASHDPKRRKKLAAPRALRKLRPSTFSGELSLRNVTFHYPTRPSPAPPALRNVSLYFAARETTYVVGISGSGKSTVGNLLLGLYKAETGQIEVDEQGLDWIDEEWLRSHVACVSQGASVLFEGTVHDNVAIGVVGQLRHDGTKRKMEDVSREEVVAACRGALIHDFIRDLPDGYDTVISGEKGASLSGGQRQRLAIARAWIRDPTVLVLDEATSALDATSRLLVNEAVKRWRTNRTTIIITHDLAPIGQDDFVYVMADAEVVQQGYRAELEQDPEGRFAQLACSQNVQSARSNEKEEEEEARGLEREEEILDSDDESGLAYPSVHSTPRIQVSDADFESPSKPSLAGFFFPPSPDASTRASRELRAVRRVSANFAERLERQQTGSRSSNQLSRPATPLSNPSSELLPPFALSNSPDSKRSSKRDSGMSFAALELAGNQATANRRPLGQRLKHEALPVGTEAREGLKGSVAIDVPVNPAASKPKHSLGYLVRRYWPTIPNKLLFFTGIFLSMVVGCCTPVFSYLLSQVMSHLGQPGSTSLVTQSSIFILVVAAVDGTSTFLKFYFLERCAEGWITSLRRRALALVLKQDKSFFDKPENTTSSLTHTIVKDSDDTRIFVGTVVGQLAVLFSMLTMAMTWAFVAGWELTLVGLGLGPVFVIATRLQASILNKFEMSNKLKRENVSKKFHQTFSNIRPIRAMSIQPVFERAFLETTEEAYRGGVKAAPFAGLGFATGFALIYCVQGLMLYVGALLIAKGRYDFAKMLRVFSLILFAVTFAGQLMGYLPSMAKSIAASIDLLRLLDLSEESSESQGRMTFPIRGDISFRDVKFAYPSRPDAPVLKGLSFSVKAGECVGIVGASGSGKSTIAALLQRLYEPSSGTVSLDNRPLSRIDVKYLRNHLAVVSQHPALFDVSVSSNISYGTPPDSIDQSRIEAAAKQAHIHDFILSQLPQGYQTLLGDNASLVSGGQAQRLQIARALVQPRELLILDECTSALDPQNQKLVMNTIMDVKKEKTTLIVTHKLAVMEMCDYLIVVDNGRVAEIGSVKELRSKPHGLFAQLASGGEWEHA
ncbi:ABC transporter ATP-binding protein [Sporobolomyces salmoneus]|uniref:ABC transporter ATP-binding protein n=1 Tax=Sporobolomyces salmoneus TaxID=183962 RepID=UPI00316F7744